MKSKRIFNRRVYLDYASITPIDKRVLVVVDQASRKTWANPSALHREGVRAQKVLEESRTAVSRFLHAHPDEIFFTASGTEANAIAINGVIQAAFNSEKNIPIHNVHILVSAIEHASVLETAKALASSVNKNEHTKIQLDTIPVKENGIVDLDVLKKMLKPETVLVSIMMVNNEIGTIQPVHEAIKIVRDFRKKKGEQKDAATHAHNYPLIHIDACQAPMYMDIDMEKLGADLLTLDSNKIYGPRGVGMLYKKRTLKIGTDIAPIFYGGGQEKGLRPGTENIPGIAGFAKALEIAVAEREGESARLLDLRNYFVQKLQQKIPDLIFNGSFEPGERSVNNINVTFPDTTLPNVTFPGIDHEFLLLELDARGIACSTKSACLRNEDESYVIRAVRGSEITAEKNDRKNNQKNTQSLRFSLGRFTTKKDIDYTLKMIDEIMSAHV